MKSISSTSSRIQEFQPPPPYPLDPQSFSTILFHDLIAFNCVVAAYCSIFLEIHFIPLVRGVEFDEELVRWPPELLTFPIVETTPEEDDVMALVPDVPQSE